MQYFFAGAGVDHTAAQKHVSWLTFDLASGYIGSEFNPEPKCPFGEQLAWEKVLWS